ncbi:beta-mannosidase [Anaeramoeba flamelloides]|uniref:Beta-mannosidase B n=1 Tax=Anaeramoeba flamelloides TaxID=1746091 RepID=A0ABQ8Z586_9EUKA|nr:beta-mannosidase [Anaeramoeba flamelloides]
MLNSFRLFVLFSLFFLVIFCSTTPVVQDLSGVWTLTNVNRSFSLDAKVPGSVQTSLESEAIIGNIYYRFNDVNYRWISYDTWSYKTTFTKQFESGNKYLLEFESIDTISEIKLNGITIGKTNNQFRIWRYDVTNYLSREGTWPNTLEVLIYPAALYAKNECEKYPYPVPGDPKSTVELYSGEYNRQFIRKAQCHFGWDWGLAPMTVAINRGVRLIEYSTARINSALVTQSCITQSTYELMVKVSLDSAISDGKVIVDVGEQREWTKTVTVTNSKEIEINMIIEEPNLWYPIGFGTQELYKVTIRVENNDDQAQDEISKQIGFRCVELIEDPAKNGGLTFYLKVNGIPIFLKGSNFVPLDLFEERITKERIMRFINSTIDANMNMVRIWGGGIYMTDEFYDIADSVGLMIMHDFQFACSMYPINKEFLSNVENEIIDQITRLSHHCSIVNWAGNNENEGALDWWPLDQQHPRLYLVDYVKLYLDTIYPLVKKMDPDRIFMPSSPSNGVLSQEPYVLRWGTPYNQSFGDVHFYDYNADCMDVSTFPSPRFASEYGYQSFDSTYAWDQISLAEDQKVDSELVNHREHHGSGILQMIEQISTHFNVGDNAMKWDNFIYLTQVQQSLCYQTETEHYRRQRSSEYQTMGALYWQGNTVWTAPSWSSIEFHQGRWKMLHYYAKNFFSDFLISPIESPTNTLSVYAINDSPLKKGDQVTMKLINWESTVLNSQELAIEVGPSQSAVVETLNVTEYFGENGCRDRTDCFIAFSSNYSPTNYFWPEYFNKLSLPTPKISVSNIKLLDQNTVEFTLQSDQIALFVFLQTTYSGKFQDNGFVMLKGEEKVLEWHAWEDFDFSKFELNLKVKDLSATFD